MGVGKSATANTICGENTFLSKHSASSVTETCKQHSVSSNGRRLLVIDTPGIFNTESDHEEIKNEIKKCVNLSAPGLHAILFVISMATRFTKEDKDTFEKYSELFGEDLYRFSIVLFTNADVLEDSAEQYVKTSPSILKTFITKCGERYTSFNNKAENREKWLQVKTLLAMIDSMNAQNENKYFTNKQFQEAEERSRKREKEIKKQAEKEFKEKVAKIRLELKEEFDRKLENLKTEHQRQMHRVREIVIQEYVEQQNEDAARKKTKSKDW